MQERSIHCREGRSGTQHWKLCFSFHCELACASFPNSCWIGTAPCEHLTTCGSREGREAELVQCGLMRGSGQGGQGGWPEQAQAAALLLLCTKGSLQHPEGNHTCAGGLRLATMAAHSAAPTATLPHQLGTARRQTAARTCASGLRLATMAVRLSTVAAFIMSILLSTT